MRGSGRKIKCLKPWYARTVVDEKQSDLFSSFASGKFDQGESLNVKYQTAQVCSSMNIYVLLRIYFCFNRKLPYF